MIIKKGGVRRSELVEFKNTVIITCWLVSDIEQNKLHGAASARPVYPIPALNRRPGQPRFPRRWLRSNDERWSTRSVPGWPRSVCTVFEVPFVYLGLRWLHQKGIDGDAESELGRSLRVASHRPTAHNHEDLRWSRSPKTSGKTELESQDFIQGFYVSYEHEYRQKQASVWEQKKRKNSNGSTGLTPMSVSWHFYNCLGRMWSVGLGSLIHSIETGSLVRDFISFCHAEDWLALSTF